MKKKMKRDYEIEYYMYDHDGVYMYLIYFYKGGKRKFLRGKLDRKELRKILDMSSDQREMFIKSEILQTRIYISIVVGIVIMLIIYYSINPTF